MIRSGELCREEASIVDWQVVEGEINNDDNVVLNFVNNTGVSEIVEMDKLAIDSLEYRPPCSDETNKNYWNGVYLEKANGFEPDNYWLIEIPVTIKYEWDLANECYSSFIVDEWFINSSFFSASIRSYTIFYGDFMSTIETPRNTQLGGNGATLEDIDPLC